MASPHELEPARLSMLEARKALEDHESLKGFTPSYEHKRLIQVFNKATQTYLTCFIRERAMRGEVESFCAPLRQVAPSWRRI